MKYLILMLCFLQTYFSLDAQVCFTYDNAGNRTKRETCVVAITTKEMDELIQVNSELTSELRSLSNTEDFSEVVVYPNPTSSTFQLRDQQNWIGAALKVVSNEGKLLNMVTITDGPIEMSHLSAGSYFLILSNGTNRKTAKLFITK